MSHICPSCGFNLQADAPIKVGDWQIDPRGYAAFKGRAVVSRASWVQILLTLASEQGRCLTSEALLNRISESERNNTIASQVSQLRRHIEGKGAPDPIETVYGRGYRWAA